LGHLGKSLTLHCCAQAATFPSPADMVLNKGVAWKLEKEESDKN